MVRISLATALVLAIAGSASAGTLNESFNLGDFFFDAHTTVIDNDPIVTTEFQPTPNDNPVIGVRISFDFDEIDAAGAPALDSSWASDLGMVLRFDNTIYGFAGSFRYLGALAGAYGLGPAEDFTDFLSVWDFDGSGSGSPGSYSHEYFFENPIPKPDLITVSLTDTWNGNTFYGNLTIELIKIPAPGAAGLLGFAGLAAMRRRR